MGSRKMIISVGGVPAYVELADNDYLRTKGLMHRKSLLPGSGMLFMWPDSAYRSFWMKNTPLPLSIAYITDQGKILNIEDMKPYSLKSVASSDSAMCALEMPQGWFRDNGIKAGDVVTGLFESNLTLTESRAFDFSSPDFYYKEVADEVIGFILDNLDLDSPSSSDSFTSEFAWQYPVSPSIWEEYWEDYGAAFFDVEVKVTPTDFDPNHPGWNIDANAGFGSSSEALIDVDIQLDFSRLADHDTLRRELYNVLPHEIHHLTQVGQPFERPNCPAAPPATGDSYFEYFTQACEVPAFLIGFRGEAAQSGLAVEQLIDNYLNNYVAVGKISSMESEEVKSRWLDHNIWGTEHIEEALLRNYIRGLLTEVTSLPQAYFNTIDDAVSASRFWESPNTQEDIDLISSNFGSVLGTPAADVLAQALQQSFDDLELDIDVVVSSMETDNIDGFTIHEDHPAYPNRWLVDAKWYVSKQNPGRNTVDLQIMTAEEPIKDLDTGALIRHVTQTVRHELVHHAQMKKQAANKGLDDTAAFEEMLQDPSQIPTSGKIEDYLRSHIEIDAHAHDGAEELLAVYGKEKSLNMLRHGFDLTDKKMPNAVKHYFEQLPEDDPTLDKLRSKLFSQIQKMS